MIKTRHKKYDLVIIGGGMVGLSLACALEAKLKDFSKQSSVKILLLESQAIVQNETHQPGFDVRSTVLSKATIETLKALNVWQKLENSAEPIEEIHISDQGHFGLVQINAKDEKVDALGWVLDNKAIGLTLNQDLLSSDTVETLSPVQVTNITHQQDCVELECFNQNTPFTISASLAVLAEGGRSGLSDKLGIHRRQQDYEQVGIIANVAFSKPHEQVAYERFTPNGPLALLPLPDFENDHRAALIWTQKAATYKDVFELSDDEFLRRLQKEFGHRVGQFTKVGQRAVFPLRLQEAEEQIRHNLVLLGNVAHTLHPIAGQGFNLSFRDTMRLAENISTSIKAGINPGSYQELQKYLHTSVQDQDLTVAFSHHLTKLFSSNQVAMVWSRKFGLLSIDLVRPLKRTLSEQAMGMGGRMLSS